MLLEVRKAFKTKNWLKHNESTGLMNIKVLKVIDINTCLKITNDLCKIPVLTQNADPIISRIVAA